MELRKVIERRIRRRRGGVDLAADVSAVVAANVGRRGGTAAASSTRHVDEEQRGARTQR